MEDGQQLIVQLPNLTLHRSGVATGRRIRSPTAGWVSKQARRLRDRFVHEAINQLTGDSDHPTFRRSEVSSFFTAFFTDISSWNITFLRRSIRAGSDFVAFNWSRNVC